MTKLTKETERLDEFEKAEWFDVMKRFRPGLSEFEFDRASRLQRKSPMTPEQEKLLRELADPEQTRNQYYRTVAQLLLELVAKVDNPMFTVPSTLLDRDGGPCPIPPPAEPAPTGHFGCVGSVCRLGQVGRIGCTHEGGCDLEKLEDRGIISPASPKGKPCQHDPLAQRPLCRECYPDEDVRADTATRARTRVRDELAELVARYALGHERGSADMLVDRILDRLIESEKAYGRPCFGDHLRRVKGRLL